jgi:hypothetical protein
MFFTLPSQNPELYRFLRHQHMPLPIALAHAGVGHFSTGDPASVFPGSDNDSDHGHGLCGQYVLWPKLQRLLREYPDIKLEIAIEYGLTDIVAQRYEASVRSADQIAKDMIAVRIGPDSRMAVVGAPSYFAKRKRRRRRAI